VERTLAKRARLPETKSDRGPYRTPSAAARGRLAIGYLPGPDEDLAVGQLRGGPERVAETLLAGALAEGWLRQGDDGGGYHVTTQAATGTVGDDYRSTLSLAANSAGVVSARDAAWHAYRYATDNRRLFVAQLRAGHLVRPIAARLTRCLVAAAGCALLVCIGVVNLWPHRPLHRPDWALPVALVVTVVFAVFIVASAGKSRVGVDYLVWLDSATRSLLGNVQGRIISSPRDIRLAVAVAGASALPAVLRNHFPSEELRDAANPGRLANNEDNF
jgi:uncharacterized protein (TIGR04222 family)